MKVISLNANGIRAAERKGVFDWFKSQDADVICIQETKAQAHQLESDEFQLPGYHRYIYDAEKKGYSGVAIYTRQKPNAVHTGLGFDLADKEGRYIQIDFEHLCIASIYLPSGSSGDERQNFKYHFLNKYEKHLEKQVKDGRDYIICGDLNIVHKEIDIKNWKSNQKNSGCLPKERAWLDKIFTEYGWVDAFRVVNQNTHEYTWWSNRGKARENNVGWRIDYQIVTPTLRDKVLKADVYKASWFSDHAPLSIEYDVKI